MVGFRKQNKDNVIAMMSLLVFVQTCRHSQSNIIKVARGQNPIRFVWGNVNTESTFTQ